MEVQQAIGTMTKGGKYPLWSGLTGAPFVTVSSVGTAQGYPINNGADFGPDTPGTTTVGQQEADTYLVSKGGGLAVLVNNQPLVITPSAGNVFTTALGLGLVTPTPGGAAGSGSVEGALTVLASTPTANLTSNNFLLVGESGISVVASDQYFNVWLAGFNGAAGITSGTDIIALSGPRLLASKDGIRVDGVAFNRPIYLINGIPLAGVGFPSIFGLDNRLGVTVPDAAPITLYTTTAAGQLYRVTIRLNATAYTSGTATYTLTWTEGGLIQTVAVSATAVGQSAVAKNLVQPDAGTTITAQITGTFIATLNVASTVEELA